MCGTKNSAALIELQISVTSKESTSYNFASLAVMRTPVPIKALMLSNIRPGQCLDGRPLWNCWCCCYGFVYQCRLGIPGWTVKNFAYLFLLASGFFLTTFNRMRRTLLFPIFYHLQL